MGKRRDSEKNENKNLNAGIFSAGIINGGLVAPSNSHDFMRSVVTNSLAIDYAIFNNYDFPFTNLVLEGGGMKGLSYLGALQVLENAGILENIKRICGVSIGSIVALFAYVGYSPDEIKDIMYGNLSTIISDHKCGYCSLIPGLIKRFGWNPGKRIEKWLINKVRIKLGNGECTFLEAYEKTGKEFCVVVTNLSRMSIEYFHVKTTPNFPIAKAVYMSMSLPAMYQPRKLEKSNGEIDWYIDGGLLCNYPIHAFDGWWLSLKPEDSFFKKMSEIDNLSTVFLKSSRFGEWNPNTIGMLLYADDEIEVLKNKFKARQGSDLPPPPKHSKMFKKRKHARHREQQIKHEEEDILYAIKILMKIINNIELTSVDCIPLQQLKESINNSDEFNEKELSILFGYDNVEEAVAEMDKDGDGEITHNELTLFIESKGIDLYSRFLGYSRREITTFGDFISAIESGLSVCLLKSYVEDRDAERTIGINTGYIETVDLRWSTKTKFTYKRLPFTCFHIRQKISCGRVAARAYLREYCRNNQDRRRRKSRQLSEHFFERVRRQSNVTNEFQTLIEKERKKLVNDPNYFPAIKEETFEDDGGSIDAESFNEVEINVVTEKLSEINLYIDESDVDKESIQENMMITNVNKNTDPKEMAYGIEDDVSHNNGVKMGEIEITYNDHDFEIIENTNT